MGAVSNPVSYRADVCGSRSIDWWCDSRYGAAGDRCSDVEVVGPGGDGADRADGADGTDGSDGADGAGGADGPDEADGADRADGADGADGVDGANGANGPDGAGGADAWTSAFAGRAMDYWTRTMMDGVWCNLANGIWLLVTAMVDECLRTDSVPYKHVPGGSRAMLGRAAPFRVPSQAEPSHNLLPVVSVAV